ncbi:MAG: MFS transporter [Anaerolineae bacterium]
MPSRKPSPGFILVVVAFGVFVAADDLTVVSTMLRQIIYDLNIPLPDGLDQAAWIVNAYLIAYVVVMPFVGRLSDIVGRRSVYVGSLALFLAGSIWAPLAPDLNGFIVGRVLTAWGRRGHGSCGYGGYWRRVRAAPTGQGYGRAGGD